MTVNKFGSTIRETVTIKRVKVVEVDSECIEGMLRNRFGLPGQTIEIEFDTSRDFLRGAIITITDETIEEVPKL